MTTDTDGFVFLFLQILSAAEQQSVSQPGQFNVPNRTNAIVVGVSSTLNLLVPWLNPAACPYPQQEARGEIAVKSLGDCDTDFVCSF